MTVSDNEYERLCGNCYYVVLAEMLSFAIIFASLFLESFYCRRYIMTVLRVYMWTIVKYFVRDNILLESMCFSHVQSIDSKILHSTEGP